MHHPQVRHTGAVRSCGRFKQHPSMEVSSHTSARDRIGIKATSSKFYLLSHLFLSLSFSRSLSLYLYLYLSFTHTLFVCTSKSAKCFRFLLKPSTQRGKQANSCSCSIFLRTVPCQGWYAGGRGHEHIDNSMTE